MAVSIFVSHDLENKMFEIFSFIGILLCYYYGYNLRQPFLQENIKRNFHDRSECKELKNLYTLIEGLNKYHFFFSKIILKSLILQKIEVPPKDGDGSINCRKSSI